VIAPRGRLLDCRVSSAVIPAHDGQLGILPDHMPIFCQLGTGPMEVKCPATENGQGEREFLLLINGGFAMFNSNNLAVTAADAVNAQTISPEKLQQLIDACKAALDSSTLPLSQRPRQRLMLKLLESLRGAAQAREQ
jgi:F-type H+-transporting ATPase subunit epsilon